ncbi:NAD-dependent deacylase [Shimia haliotis]|uniref:NAD-dependent protein deacylase n=1 Tax=Shimia haliotis TaxID=1280847 RepID=A0A1I4F0X6_9RHOB|nr:NAD-dependent deacylase [Shimia haliotis]SFL11642.1 NAD-dependent deacetylase [Shimia haliotis]
MTGTIVILTGAGISAESGLGTFRDVDGLWTKYDLNDVATPEGFARNPELVMEFYNARRANALAATPNAAHDALAKLEANYSGEVFLVTQNVDGLHEAAGSRNVLHMHGALASALCGACGHRWPANDIMATSDPCPRCKAPATRPDVVWFGEVPYGMHVISEALARAETFVSIGTSGEVYPAANFVAEATQTGAHTVELNLDPSAGASRFAETRFGPATEVVPRWVDDVLAGAK